MSETMTIHLCENCIGVLDAKLAVLRAGAVTERDQARKWAAAWKRAAKWRCRPVAYSVLDLEYSKGFEAGSNWENGKAWLTAARRERDNAREVARALYKFYVVYRTRYGDMCECDRCLAYRKARHVLSEVARRERGLA